MKKKWLAVFAVLAAVAVGIAFPAVALLALILAFIGGILYLAWSMNKKEKALAAQQEAERKAAAEAAAAAKKEAEEQERKRKEEAKADIENRKQRFHAELSAIPQVEIKVSAPAPRQYLKDMPDWGYSSVTKTAKLTSIFPLVFLDVETTGLKAAYSEIVEVAAVKFDAGMNPVATFSALCKPKKPIPPEITKINGITNEMVENCPNFHEIAPALSAFLEGCNLAGHNLGFDVEFLYVHGTQLPFDKKFYDTLQLAQRTISKSDIWNHKLGTVCSWYGIHRDDAHRALSDCYATSKIFTNLVFDKTSRMLDDGSWNVSDSDT